MAKHKSEPLVAPFGEKKILLHTCCAPCSSAIVEALLQAGITPVIYYCNPNIYPFEEYEIRKNECSRFAHSLGLEIIDADYDHEAWRCQIAGLENEPERGSRCLKCFKIRLLAAARYAAEHGIRVISTTLASSRWKSLGQINEAGFWACGAVNAENGFEPAECTSAGQACSESACHAVGSLGSDTDFSQVSSTGYGTVMKNGERQSVRTLPETCNDRNEVIWWDRNWRKNGLQDRRNALLKQYNFYNQLYCGCEYSMRPACDIDELASGRKVE